MATQPDQNLPKPVLWRFRDVEAYLNLSRTSIYKLVRRDPAFPKPFHITRKLRGWYRTEIEEYAMTLRDRQQSRAS